jgi:hypothetical protein
MALSRRPRKTSKRREHDAPIHFRHELFRGTLDGAVNALRFFAIRLQSLIPSISIQSEHSGDLSSRQGDSCMMELFIKQHDLIG